MTERTEARFDIKPEALAADLAYGSGPNLNWLVNDKKIASHQSKCALSDAKLGCGNPIGCDHGRISRNRRPSERVRHHAALLRRVDFSECGNDRIDDLAGMRRD